MVVRSWYHRSGHLYLYLYITFFFLFVTIFTLQQDVKGSIAVTFSVSTNIKNVFTCSQFLSVLQFRGMVLRCTMQNIFCSDLGFENFWPVKLHLQVRHPFQFSLLKLVTLARNISASTKNGCFLLIYLSHHAVIMDSTRPSPPVLTSRQGNLLLQFSMSTITNQKFWCAKLWPMGLLQTGASSTLISVLVFEVYTGRIVRIFCGNDLVQRSPSSKRCKSLFNRFWLSSLEMFVQMQFLSS